MYKFNSLIVALCIQTFVMLGQSSHLVRGQFEDNEESFEEDVEQRTTPTTPTSSTVAALITPKANTSTPSPAHVQDQVNHILTNVNSFNITGIVDSALGIRNDVPVRNLVNGILGIVFCNIFLANLNNCGNRQKSGNNLTEKLVPMSTTSSNPGHGYVYRKVVNN